MMPKTLQAPAIIILVVVLLTLRLLPVTDPAARFVRSLVRDDKMPDTAASNDARVRNLEERIRVLENELGLKTNNDNDLIAANVINKTAVSFRQAVRIDRGSQDGIKPDQPVLFDGYLIGIIQTVEPDVSTVVMIGDPDVVVPVRIGESQGAVQAYAGGVLIDQVVGDVEPGEPVVTSGVGGLYPPGLLVGMVGSEVERDVYGQYVLERPHRLFEIEVVQVVL
jgi:rod shape-determining protein MreC